MGEKNYFVINDEGGTVKVAQDVIAGIAAMACQEIDGVHGMAPGGDGSVKGVVFGEAGDGAYSIDAHIVVKMGAVLADVALAAQESIKAAVESSVGARVSAVNVFVASVAQK